jgi:glutamyl-Q tRNA(Asp) synthetase
MYSRILRFAPSPNGYLHLGHAYSALLNHDLAREFGGRLLLRIEDIDVERCRPDYEAAIHEDLRWLGISWIEPVRRQSEYFDDYTAALTELEAQGLLYPSFESRSELNAMVAELDGHGHWPRDPDGVAIYPGRARKLSAAERARRRAGGEPFARRRARRPDRHRHCRTAAVG